MTSYLLAAVILGVLAGLWGVLLRIAERQPRDAEVDRRARDMHCGACGLAAACRDEIEHPRGEDT